MDPVGGLLRFIRGILIPKTETYFIEGKNITIEERCKLDHHVLVRVNEGGSIHIQSETELLYGVVIISYFNSKIRIGKNCSINPYTIIYGVGDTIIGDNVLIAGHCMIIPNQHKFDSVDLPIKDQGHTMKGITIENDVWIGHGSTIMDGVTIGNGAIIAAGSIVNRSVEPFEVVGGVPIRHIKFRTDALK